MSSKSPDFDIKTIVDIHDTKGVKKVNVDVNNVYWSNRQRKIWVISLFLGSVMAYLTRVSGPVTVVAMGQDLGWDKTVAVSILLTKYFIFFNS